MNRFRLAIGVAIAATCIPAQSNSRGPGYDAALYDIDNARYWGRRGPAYPGGEIGVSFSNGLCNPGSMNIEWRAPMLEDHPKFGFLVTRLQNGRMVQVSDASFCKHAFLSLNDPNNWPSICGSPCANTSSAQVMYVGCTDVYSNGNNGSRNYLGPPDEIDPWLGTWNHIGSYFDRGDPDVGPPGNTDGVRSPINYGFSQPVQNRVTIREQDLVGAQNGDLFFQIHVICEGEPATNRDNNIMSRPFHLWWTGTTWSRGTYGSPTHGSILTRWPGSTLTMGGNGNDDGRFAIAVKVTGPTDGLWRYEYAVHNIDNSRGAAAFRIPICPTAQITNAGFRDIDGNALSDWTINTGGGEIAWTAPSTNPHNWNQVFNFWFDCDIAPTAGQATFDAARLGPGALQFSVATTVPGEQPTSYLGPGCGSPTIELRGNGLPQPGNNGYGIDVYSAPATGFFSIYSFGAATTQVAPGCDRYLGNPEFVHTFLVTDGAGRATIPLGIPSWFVTPMNLHWQAASLIPGGPIFGDLGLSNGLTVHIAGTGCQ